MMLTNWLITETSRHDGRDSTRHQATKEAKQAIKSYFGGLILTLVHLSLSFKLDTELHKKMGKEDCEMITFIRSHNSKRKEDKPIVNLAHPDYKQLIRYIKRRKLPLVYTVMRRVVIPH